MTEIALDGVLDFGSNSYYIWGVIILVSVSGWWYWFGTYTIRCVDGIVGSGVLEFLYMFSSSMIITTNDINWFVIYYIG